MEWLKVRNLLVDIHDASGASTLSSSLRSLSERCMDPDLLDDRFDDGFEQRLLSENDCFVAMTATIGDQLVGYVGGFVAHTDSGSSIDLDLLIDRAHPDPIAQSAELLGILTAELTRRAERGLDAQLWTKPTFPWHETLAEHVALKPERALYQMRAPLPIDLQPLATRAFRPGVDNEAVRGVNNRAFAWHPDQGSQSTDDFNAGLSQAWVNPDGIRLHEVDGQLAGFCWTKIHVSPALGEIYVIAVDPDFHGQGLGKPMTAAGLQWLHQNGQDTAMLYVEADNEPALATYERLGFTTVRTDRSWRLAI